MSVLTGAAVPQPLSLMRAAVVPGAGAAWQLQEIPAPHPGPGEVLVRVRACGVCSNDVKVAAGDFPFPSYRPVVLGHEAAGDIADVGPGVTSRMVGDRVGVPWIQGTCGRCGSCRSTSGLTGRAGMGCLNPRMSGLTAPGAHAEFVVVPADCTVLLPGELAYELAAPVMCAGYTAWSGLVAAEPRPTDRVAIVGIGGLGHLALQYAHACGFETVAVTRSPDKRKAAEELGAGKVVTSGEELREVGGADVVLVTGASLPAASDSLIGLRSGGRLVLATIDPTGSFTIDPAHQFFAKQQRVVAASHDGLPLLEEALAMVASGAVTPRVEVFDAERVGEAVERVASGDVRYRAVVTYD